MAVSSAVYPLGSVVVKNARGRVARIVGSELPGWVMWMCNPIIASGLLFALVIGLSRAS